MLQVQKPDYLITVGVVGNNMFGKHSICTSSCFPEKIKLPIYDSSCRATRAGKVSPWKWSRFVEYKLAFGLAEGLASWTDCISLARRE